MHDRDSQKNARIENIEILSIMLFGENLSHFTYFESFCPWVPCVHGCYIEILLGQKNSTVDRILILYPTDPGSIPSI